MNKKYIIIISSGVLLIGSIAFCIFKSPSLKKVMKNASEFNDYELVANMEMLENDELKSYQVTSTYAKIDNQDYYKVELYDKSLNQGQYIVRNDQGVFVLTPSLNQAFQFQSEWPHNSLKPYIYQSLLSFVKDNKVEKVKDGYLVNGKMVYENDERVKSQEVKLDKLLNPQYVTVFDEDGKEIIKLTMTSFKKNQKIKKESFMQDTIMKETKKTNIVSSFSPQYPVALMGSTLTHEETTQIDNVKHHILQFTGDKTFTIVEKDCSNNENYEIEKMSGDFIDLISGIAFKDDNQMTYFSSSMVCSLYSNDLSKQEMLSVVSSMQTSLVK